VPLSIFADPDEGGASPDMVLDNAWVVRLRRFGRGAVWSLPVGALLLALGGMWGWPTSTEATDGKSPGTWLLFTVAGLVCGLFGVLALTALMSESRGRLCALLGLFSAIAGTVMVAPILGVIGLARPAVTRLGNTLGPAVAADLDSRFFGGRVSHWLGVGGLTLLGIGCAALGLAVLLSRTLNRTDGMFLFGVVAVAGLAAFSHFQFLVVIAAMLLLAAGLGLAWTASRLTPDGAPPVD
jgi:hypothetical protein